MLSQHSPQSKRLSKGSPIQPAAGSLCMQLEVVVFDTGKHAAGGRVSSREVSCGVVTSRHTLPPAT